MAEQRPFQRKKSLVDFSREHKDEDVQRMKELFALADVDKDGTVSKKELKSVMELLGMHVSDRGFEAFFSALDRDNNGIITFPEFQNGFKTLAKAKKPEAAIQRKSSLHAFARNFDRSIGRDLFDAIDTDKNGSISQAELKAVLLSQKHAFTAADFDQLWALLDDNSDGRVSFEEFQNAMTWMSVHVNDAIGEIENTDALLFKLSEGLVRRTIEKAENALAKGNPKTARSLLEVIDLSEIDYLQASLPKGYAEVLTPAQRERILAIRKLE
jgi:Ca2+-binding EF-hand superfamily protein